MPILQFSAILFALALATALILTPWIRAGARRFGAVDHPDGQRKLHGAPIPKLGGIAVFAGFYVAVGIALLVWDHGSAESAIDLVWRTLGPSLLILFLGIVDDLWGLKPSTKVIVQLIAASWICLYPDLRIAALWNPFGMTIGGLGVLSIPMTLAWIILITNAFNIVDGMDGLASGVAFVATACLFVAAIQRPDSFIPLLVAPLGGALVGFLRYNFNPASIFLGDSGSLWIGFQVAVFSIASQNKSSTAVAVAAPLLSLALPLIETWLSALRRFLRGQPIWQADAGHIHHQLLKRGLSARRAAILLYAGSGLFGAASLLIGDSNDANRMIGGVITLTLVGLAWLGIQQLGYSEFIEVNHAFKRGFLYQRRIIQNGILIRKLLDDLKCAKSLTEAWPLLVEVIDRLSFAKMVLVMERAEAADSVFAPGPIDLLGWKSDARFAVARDGDWSVIAVHLIVDRRLIGRVELWRLRSEEPLHSELAALLDVIAEQMPRLLPTASPEHVPTYS